MSNFPALFGVWTSPIQILYQTNQISLLSLHLEPERRLNDFSIVNGSKKQPRQGDWYSEIQNILEEFELNISEDEIKIFPANQFKKMVKSSASIAGIKYLKLKQQK